MIPLGIVQKFYTLPVMATLFPLMNLSKLMEDGQHN
jgi:hypothetical protein